jgi:hypothetical protein
MLVLATAAPAFADNEPDAPNAPLRIDPAALKQAGRRATWRRNVGIGLTIPGVFMAVIGGTLIVHGVFQPNLLGGGQEIVTGSVVGGVGLFGLSIAGIVLWITGQDDMDVVEWRRKQQSVSISPNGFSIRF